MFTGQDNRRLWRFAAVFAMAGALSMSGCAKNTESGSGSGSASSVAPTDLSLKPVQQIADSVLEAFRREVGA